MSTQTRGTPSGTMMHKPLGIKVAIEDNLTLEVKEKNVTPPGFNLGDPYNTTTHHNTKRMSREPKTLYDRKPLVFTCTYDATALNTLFGLKGTKKWVTITYPDGVTEDDYGWVNRAEPAGMAAEGGDPPELEVEIQWAGVDDAGDEYDVDWKEAAGSDI